MGSWLCSRGVPIRASGSLWSPLAFRSARPAAGPGCLWVLGPGSPTAGSPADPPGMSGTGWNPAGGHQRKQAPAGVTGAGVDRVGVVVLAERASPPVLGELLTTTRRPVSARSPGAMPHTSAGSPNRPAPAPRHRGEHGWPRPAGYLPFSSHRPPDYGAKFSNSLELSG